MTKTREELRYAAQECKDIRGLPPRWYDFDTLAITCGIGHTDAMFIAACSPDVILSLIAENDALKAQSVDAALRKDAERFKRIAELVSSIYAHGGFFAETRNERELEAELRAAGMFFKTPQEYSAAMSAQQGESK
jgi:hypothetical protein